MIPHKMYEIKSLMKLRVLKLWSIWADVFEQTCAYLMCSIDWHAAIAYIHRHKNQKLTALSMRNELSCFLFSVNYLNLKNEFRCRSFTVQSCERARFRTCVFVVSCQFGFAFANIHAHNLFIFYTTNKHNISDEISQCTKMRFQLDEDWFIPITFRLIRNTIQVFFSFSLNPFRRHTFQTISKMARPHSLILFDWFCFRTNVIRWRVVPIPFKNACMECWWCLSIKKKCDNLNLTHFLFFFSLSISHSLSAFSL